MKKIIAVILSAFMLLSLCACNTNGGDNTTAAVDHAVPAGRFVLSCGAIFEIVYDDEGLVISVAGLNDPGVVLAADDEEFLGKSCADLATELVSTCKERKYLEAAKYVLLKQGENSQLPGTNFLEGIVTAVETAAGDVAALTVVEEKDLLEGGYLPQAVAKELLMNHLSVDTLEGAQGEAELTEESYVFTVKIDGEVVKYVVDAITGAVAESDDFIEEDEDFKDDFAEDPDFEGGVEEEPEFDIDVETELGD